MCDIKVDLSVLDNQLRSLCLHISFHSCRNSLWAHITMHKDSLSSAPLLSVFLMTVILTGMQWIPSTVLIYIYLMRTAAYFIMPLID